MRGKIMNFADFFHNRRISLGHTLRNFCRKNDYDVAYVSRLENGLISPPAEKEKIAKLASALKLRKKSSDWIKFMDLASASRGEIPDDLRKHKPELVQFLPAFYRTLRKKKVNDKEIDKLMKLLKGVLIL
jgi:transcriptional regulator with XRE-family HTH domain